jgi:iron(III) transport system ATP-binding protein
MTVNQNVAYPLNMKRVPADDKRSRVDTLLDATKLKAQADRYPSELSGGQQQRVALARALAPKPDILLMDEPLSNLDASLRGDMRLEIRRLHDHFRYTSIYVTHDQTEAMTMADRIVVMNGGRIEQIGTPEDVYEQPNSEFVARFIGGSNVIKVTHVAGKQVDLGGRLLEIGHGDFAGAGKPMSICVKTHDVELLPNDAPSDGSTFPGRVRNHAYLGSHRDYVVDVGQDIVVAAPSLLNIPNGQAVSVRIKADRCRGLAR